MTRHLRLAIYYWATQMVWLLEFEPTWFPEFGFAIGAIGWGLGGFFTSDLTLRGWEHVLPGCSILLGVARCFVLLRLWYGARVVLSGLTALLLAWIWWGLATHYGVVPTMGFIGGAFLIELLTASKFSIPCARELRDEYVAWHNAR